MPVYLYHCSACNKDFEALQKIDDRARALCPDCGTACVLQVSLPQRAYVQGGTGAQAGQKASGR